MNTPAIRKPLVARTPQGFDRSGNVERDLLSDFTRVRRTAVILFLGSSAFYLSFSPTSIAGQGYTGEENKFRFTNARGRKCLGERPPGTSYEMVPTWSCACAFRPSIPQVRQNVCVSGFRTVVSPHGCFGYGLAARRRQFPGLGSILGSG